MSIFLWCMGQEIFGVGATREEAEKDALDRIFEQTLGPIEQAVRSMVKSENLEGLVPSLEMFKMRGAIVEYGLIGPTSGPIDFNTILIKQLRGQVERGVAVFPNAPPPPVVAVVGPPDTSRVLPTQLVTSPPTVPTQNGAATVPAPAPVPSGRVG